MGDLLVLDLQRPLNLWLLHQRGDYKALYPKQDGMLIISQTGNDWIKIRFMGKERRVEIDDRVPCDYHKSPFLACSNNIMEIWPQLLMKAILKV